MEEDIRERWREYFEELLNVENEQGELGEALLVVGPVELVSLQEVKEAIKRMKDNK